MAKPKNNCDIKYKQRLKELKEKLKPYRDSQTVNLLRVITGSSGRLLHKYWESLESVLTGQYSPIVVKQRIQNVANLILRNGESTKRVFNSKTIEHSMVSENFIHLRVDSNVSDNEIDSKANEVDNVKHVNIHSDSNVVDNVRRVNIDSRSSMSAKYHVLGNETHGNINSNSNVLDNANVTNRLRHLHLNDCNAACYNTLHRS